MIPRLVLAVFLLFALRPALAATEPAEVHSLFADYYADVARGDMNAAIATLSSILALDPENRVAWRALGYAYAKLGRHRQAARAFRRAGGDRDDADMALAAGYSYDAAGDKRNADIMFTRALDTWKPAVYDAACAGAVNDAPLAGSPLPSPWYASLYSAPVYLSRFPDFVFPTTVRVGRYIDAAHRLSLYAYADDTQDTASSGGAQPVIYNDDYLGTGFGVDLRPFPKLGFDVFAQGGSAVDVPGRNRPAWRFDSRLGADFYRLIGAPNRCGAGLALPLKPFADLYLAGIRYSRYAGDVIGQATMRVGLRLWRFDFSTISLYGQVATVADTDRVYYNNFIEMGPGLSWHPDLRLPVQFRLAYLFGRYLTKRAIGDRDLRYRDIEAEVIIALGP